MSQLCKDCTHKNKDCTDKDTKHLIWCYMFNSKAREKARVKREKEKLTQVEFEQLGELNLAQEHNKTLDKLAEKLAGVKGEKI